MKSLILRFLICAAAALAAQSAMAADASSAKSRPTATGKRSMAEKGTFHRVHARKTKTDCEDCHSKEPYASNVLLISRERPLAKGSPGVVDPRDCYECHRQKSNRLPLYAPR